MLKSVKRTLLKASRLAGIEAAVRGSDWRRRRLVILCYHSLSLVDEHEWNAPLFMKPEDFEARLERLRRGQWNVLPLDDAIRRLYAGDLPERSVVITFDDGTHDVYSEALPRLQWYGFPATVYLTTYYCENNLPVFPPFCSYMLWVRRGGRVRMRELTGSHETLELHTPGEREHALLALLNFAQREELSAAGKQDLLIRLARELKLDFDELVHRRVLHIMTPAEVTDASRRGLDIQLHTHRHRTPLDPELFRREIEENRSRIVGMTGIMPDHFCYPSGVHKPEFAGWLAEEGVQSATVCNTGIASSAHNRWRIPRVVDHSGLSPVEFDGWLAGTVTLLPKRGIRINEVDRSGRAVLPGAPAAV